VLFCRSRGNNLGALGLVVLLVVGSFGNVGGLVELMVCPCLRIVVLSNVIIELRGLGVDLWLCGCEEVVFPEDFDMRDNFERRCII